MFIKKNGRIFKNIGRIKDLLHCQHLLLCLPEIYHPILVQELNYLTPRRSCEDRLALILSDMAGSFGNVIDIGSQIGFFSLSLAARGYDVLGIDMNEKNIKVAKMIKKLGFPSASARFEKFNLTPESCSKLPVSDYTLCLAVFHHIIYYQGISAADEIIAVLRKKTRKKLYFEIGQSNEKIDPWSNCLSDMEDNPFQWISSFLKKGGFSEVRSLGMVSTHLSNVKRYLIAAR